MASVLSALLCLWLLIGTIGEAQAASRSPLTLFVAASAVKPVEMAVQLFQQDHDVEVRVSAAASSVLARQLNAGAPAHVYVSANPDWMTWAADRNLIAGETRTSLMGNRLVVVTPASGRLSGEPGDVLKKAAETGRIAVADPDHVPAGIYARAALETLGLWETLGPVLARAAHAPPAITLYAPGEVPAGIAYASDALLSKRVRIAADIPASAHPPVIYQAAVVKVGDSPSARALLAHLLQPASQAIFTNHGFATAKPGKDGG